MVHIGFTTSIIGCESAIIGKIKYLIVRTGVVSHPVSELGERGGSPARRQAGAPNLFTQIEDRTRLSPCITLHGRLRW